MPKPGPTDPRKAFENWFERGRFAAGQLGVAGGVAVLGLLGIIAVATLLSRHRGDAGTLALITHVDEGAVDPAALIAGAARGHRFVFLADIQTAAEPKRLAADAIEAAASEAGLDVLVLEVPVTEQPYIDEYLDNYPEDATVLLRRPAALRAHTGTELAYLEVYRRVWKVNRELGAGRGIRIVAADLPDWPPATPLQPRALARLLAERNAHLAATVDEEILARNPRARVLFFVDGYHGLQTGRGEVRLSGSGAVTLHWLGARLVERFPGDVFTILVDGARTGIPLPGTYNGTRVAGQIRGRRSGGQPVAVRVDRNFDFLHQPIHETGGPGFAFELRPRQYRLRDVADAYIHLGGR